MAMWIEQYKNYVKWIYDVLLPYALISKHTFKFSIDNEKNRKFERNKLQNQIYKNRCIICRLKSIL